MTERLDNTNITLCIGSAQTYVYCTYIYIYIYMLYDYIYIYIYGCIKKVRFGSPFAVPLFRAGELRPVHLLRVSLLRALESNFPGDSLYNYLDMIVPTP